MLKNSVLVFLFITSVLWGGGVKVPAETDLVILKNGKVIKGTVLCSGSKSVIILIDEVEETFPMEQVREIKRGKKLIETISYITGSVDGIEQIVGKGEYTPPVPKASAGTEKPAVQKPGTKPAKRGTQGAALNRIRNLLNSPAMKKKLEKLKDPKKVDEFLKKNNILMNKDIRKILKDLSNT